MTATLDRRRFLRRAMAAAGWGFAMPLLAACAPAATTGPTAAPPQAAKDKPTEAPKAAGPTAGAAPAATQPAAAPAVAKAVTKVSYGMASVNPYHIVAVVGAEKPDLTRSHGVEFETITTQNSPNAVQAVVGGSLNIASVTPEATWPAQDKTPDLFQIIGSANGTPYALIVNPEIRQVAELKGKTLGASALRGGADTTALKILLLENGLKEADYSIVQAGSVAERTAAMRAGTIQGCTQLEPQATQLREAGFSELDNADNYPPLKNVQSLVLISRKNWYESNMDTAVAFARAWIDVTKWIYEPGNKEEVNALMMSTMKVDASAAENAYDRHIVKSKVPPLDPRVSLEMAQQMAENQRKVGTENVPDDLAKFIDNRVVERAMA
jgi:NitT/TauT family transport system substrate-binding protein